MVVNEKRWERLVAAMLDRPGTTYGSGDGPKRAFGSTSLKTEARIFAMLVNGRLVVKLARGRVDELADASRGERFDPGHGRIQKEWLVVAADADDDWLALATESEAYVARR